MKTKSVDKKHYIEVRDGLSVLLIEVNEKCQLKVSVPFIFVRVRRLFIDILSFVVL